MDIALSIDYLVKYAVYSGSVTDNKKESYDKIKWDDPRKKPTWNEIQSAWGTLNKTIEKEMSDKLREGAFRKEADPLYFKFAAGEISKDVWIQKRNEIKQRIPEVRV